MSPAELKTLREACGLSVADLAAMAQVQERTARYWESGSRGAVPADVCDLVREVDSRIERAAQDLAAGVSSGELAPCLVRFRENAELWYFRPEFRPLPAAAWGAVLWRCQTTLQARGLACSIHYMDAAAYARWRGNRPDSEALRCEWASMNHSAAEAA